MDSLVDQMVKNLPALWETRVPSPGQEDPLEKGMAAHSSTLAWRTPWTEEPGGLQCLWSQRSDMTAQLSMNSRATLMGSVVKNLPANAGDTGSIHDLGRSHMHQASKPVCRNY